LLAQGKWDAVIDTCGQEPETLQKSVSVLKQCAPQYTFISSISAYKAFPKPGLTEANQLREGSENNYGDQKAACERVVQQEAPASLIVRPGLIVGPNDPSDRFTYWPTRIARGGKVLAPGRPDRQIQFIDVRDLSVWIIECLEQKRTGAFIAAGPHYVLTMAEFLNLCRGTLNRAAELVWFKIDPWMQMPLWVPESDEEHVGFMSIDASKAWISGLESRAIEETIADTLAWDQTRDAGPERKAGLAQEVEEGALNSKSGRLIAGHE
jgi:2'-hydroxyisoflavone reductase